MNKAHHKPKVHAKTILKKTYIKEQKRKVNAGKLEDSFEIIPELVVGLFKIMTKTELYLHKYIAEKIA